jgi:hypothetical protein
MNFADKDIQALATLDIFHPTPDTVGVLSGETVFHLGT